MEKMSRLHAAINRYKNNRTAVRHEDLSSFSLSVGTKHRSSAGLNLGVELEERMLFASVLALIFDVNVPNPDAMRCTSLATN